MTKVPDFPSTNRCQVRAGGLCQSTVDKATCKPREKTMSAKKRSPIEHALDCRRDCRRDRRRERHGPPWVIFVGYGGRRCYLIGYQCPRRLSRHCCYSSWLRQSWSCPVLREALSGPQSPHPVLYVLNSTKTVLLFPSFVGRIRRFLIKKSQKRHQDRSITQWMYIQSINTK